MPATADPGSSGIRLIPAVKVVGKGKQLVILNRSEVAPNRVLYQIRLDQRSIPIVADDEYLVWV
ncbi:MAG: hypothetical protein J7L35_10510, partial [Anaerolineales bacterium]|nr:hypothetical protein [Anaerolineales bacterium]